MRYPNFLNKGDTVGVTATSAGVGYKINNYNKSIENIRAQGYNIRETENVRKNDIFSSSPKERGLQLKDLFQDPKVKIIICATGGMFQFDMMPYIDYEVIDRNEKWVMGYSDPTSLLYTITTKLDIATLYGNNASSFDQNKIHESLENCFEIVKGNMVKQYSFEHYEKKGSGKDDFSGYNLTERVEWLKLRGHENFKGRCIGGCLEVLCNLVGTEYDYTKVFLEKYKDNGIVWYLDVCEMDSAHLYLALLQLKYAGWFKHSKAFVFGRVAIKNEVFGMTYSEAILRALYDIENISIIMDADIGHVAPKMTMINGAIIQVNWNEGKGDISFSLK
ncbi:Muramoyltetrapeptide carboxypeptidase LdcA (peptidoglycan recycling) [Hathewaya proteolytica DSM 3090]|uniref:Muramoyltetrapeptide carboxypeptidase LdcA (Peptidoglycan recycling) n=1 Tax=Hathewaya proteolytica DSM 3090 TaxID=1121331 RepID=A0A1M6N781_9CLOT|nr:S66 peptidase family protein [Hathewaya proteolytica]SHJ91578.1 Muramoyltetrapeptide carboxypeptidase LdcA (peptidoglycan recycling) [Hathewaya proteolytica DSM 3090]